MGHAGAVALKYDNNFLTGLAPEILEPFCGVGNPFLLGKIQPGDVVLDVGCGACVDLIWASTLTGKNGLAHGVDINMNMVHRARKNLELAGISNAQITHISSEKLPFENNTFNIAISNGVINLSPCKQQLFKEIYRVLKPGGQLQFADMILEKDLPAHMAGSLEAWAQ